VRTVHALDDTVASSKNIFTGGSDNRQLVSVESASKSGFCCVARRSTSWSGGLGGGYSGIRCRRHHDSEVQKSLVHSNLDLIAGFMDGAISAD